MGRLESLPHLCILFPSDLGQKAALLSTPFPELASQVPQSMGLKTYYYQTTRVRRAPLFPAVKKLQSVSWETSVRLPQVLLHSQVKSEQAGKV